MYVPVVATPKLLRRLLSMIEVGDIDQCWPWKGSVVRGYGQFSVSCGEERKMWKAHRVVYVLCCDDTLPEEGVLVCHHCDNPVCCNPSHLFAGTSQDNSDDMKSKDRQIRLLGHNNPMWGKPGPMRGRTGDDNPWQGRKHSDTTRAKMVESQLRRYQNEHLLYDQITRK